MDQAIEAVLKGQYFVTSLLTREIVTGLSSEEGGMFSQRQDLTPRQREVLQLIAGADHQRNRGTLLNISPKPWSSTRPKSFSISICARLPS